MAEALAALPDGHTLVLHFSDLALAPDRAKARQFLLAGDFRAQTATAVIGPVAFTRTSSTPDPIFPLNKSEPITVTFMSETAGSVSIVAVAQYELTYLGTTSARELMARTSPPLVSPGFEVLRQQIEADAAAFRGPQAASAR